MFEKIEKEGLLDKIYESVAQGKLSPEEALDFLLKMDIDRKKTLSVLASLHTGEVSVSDAKKKIIFLATHKEEQHKRPT